MNKMRFCAAIMAVLWIACCMVGCDAQNQLMNEQPSAYDSVPVPSGTVSEQLPSDVPTEPSVIPPTEVPTEPPTEPPTQPPVEPPTEPPTEPPQPPPVPEKPSTEYIGSLYTRGQLAAMSSKNLPYGPGQSKDSKGRPRGALDMQKIYGKYDTHFIGPDDGNIYLTFDLGWEYKGLTHVILDTLKEKNVKAVFFVVKSYCSQNPDIIRRIIDEGHVLANHSYHHTTLAELSIDEIVEEIMDLHQYVLDRFGYEMTLFRPPSGEYSEQVLAIAQSLGYTTVQWSYAYVDWEVDNQPEVDKSYQRLMKAAHSGCIYLLHAVSTTNAALLGDLIDGLRAEGYGLNLFGATA